MTTFVEAGLGNALVALVLAVVALVVGLVCRRPAVAHALWLLVLLKLVTPPLMSVSMPWPREGPEIREVPTFAVTLEEMPTEYVEEPFVERPEELPPAEAVAPMEEFPTPEIPYSPPSWQTLFGFVWLMGSLTWFAVAARRLWRFARLLRHARPASAELTQRVAALSRTLGMRKPPRILLLQGHLSPMVWALGTVTLLVPAKLVSTMSAAALDTLLAHELAHIRRRDHWVRWLELVGLGLYWWNPVVWLARRELRQAEELCCDAWVVRCLPDARRVYATALVDALDFLSRPDEPVPALGCGLGRVDDLKWRLTMILRGQTSPRLGWTTTLGVFALAVLLLPLVPGFGAAQPATETTIPVNPGVNHLDPESLAKLKAELNALIEKRVAEAQAKKARAEIDSQQADEQYDRAKQIQALRADIRAKTTALKQLEEPGKDLTVDDVRTLQLGLAQSLEALKDAENQLRENPTKLYKERLDARREQVAAIQRKWIAAKQRTTEVGENVTVRIEITAKAPVDLKAMANKIEKMLDGSQSVVTVSLVRPGVTSANPFSRSIRPSTNNPPATKVITPPSPDGRIDALEQKLDAVLRELEALRRARVAPSKNTKPEKRPGAAPVFAPPPANDPPQQPAAFPATETDFGRKPGLALPPGASPQNGPKPVPPGTSALKPTPAAHGEKTPPPATTSASNPTAPATGR